MQAMEREKMFGRHTSEEVLIPRIYKELVKINKKKRQLT